MNRQCIPDKPFETMSKDEQNRYIHAKMLALKRDWESSLGTIYEDVTRYTAKELRDAGKTPQEAMEILNGLKQQFYSISSELGTIAGMVEKSPAKTKEFFEKFASFFDPKTGMLDEVKLQRAIHTDRNFQHLYGRYRKAIYEYFSFKSAHPELPDADANAYVAKILGIKKEVPMGSTMSDPLKPDSTFKDVFYSWGGSKIAPSRDAMRDFGHYDIWKEGNARRRVFDREFNKALEEIKEVISPEFMNDLNFRQRITFLREGAHTDPTHEAYQMFQEMPPTAEELKGAARLGQWFDKWGKRFEIPEEIWQPNYVMRVRKFGTYDPAVHGKAHLKDMPFLRMTQMLERTGELNPRETDAFLIMNQYARSGLKYEIFAKDGWYEAARERLKNIPESAVFEREVYTDYLEDTIAHFSERQKSRQARAEAMGKLFEKLLGKRLTPEQARVLPKLFYKTQLAGALGLRLTPILKQGAQQLLIGGAFAREYILKGAAAALKPELREYARKVANITELSREGFDQALEATFGEAAVGILNKYSKFLDSTLKGFTKADEANRLTSFWAGKLMLEDAVKDYWAGKISLDKFYKRVKFRWFDGMGDIQQQMRELLARKNDMEFLRKVGDEYGRQHMLDVNFSYRPGDAPLIARRHPLMAQFATWPANFLANLKRHIEYTAKTGDFSGLAYYGGFLGGLIGVGAGTGYDFRSLFGYSSLLYTGGPTLHLGLDAAQMVKNWYYGSDNANISNKKFVSDLSVYLPAGLALRQFVTGMSEGDLLKSLGIHTLFPKEGSTAPNFFQ